MDAQIPFYELAAIIAIAGTIFSGAWVVGRLYANRIREKTDLCVQLHEDYFSQDMMNCRADGWDVLERLNDTRPFIFSKFWADDTIKDDMNAAYRVMAFFYRLHVLDSLGKLNRKLAHKLFSYQYAHWRSQLTPLVSDTLKYDQDRPEVLVAFTGRNLKWLVKDAQIFNPLSDSEA